MDPREFLKIERAIAARLRRASTPLLTDVFTRVAAAIKKDDFAQAYAEAATLNLRPAVDQIREYLKIQLLSAGYFGAQMCSGRKTPAIAAGTYDTLLEQCANQFALAIEYGTTVDVYERLMQLTAKAERGEFTVKKSAETQKRFVEEFVSFKKDADAGMMLVSSQHTSRLATWGFTAEAEVFKVDTYRLTAVLDGRTSDYCRMIHGKEFEVEAARKTITAALSVSDPQQLRSIHPWPPQAKADIEAYRAMTPAQLQARGFHVPPFHPWCRTLCARVGAKVVGEGFNIPVNEDNPHVTVTQGAFDAIGATIKPAELTKWNEQIGRSPTVLMANLTGLDATVLAGKPLGRQRVFTFAADDSLKMRAWGPLAGAATMAEVHQVWDKHVGTLYLSRLEFDAGPVAAAAFVRAAYRGAGENARVLGAASVEVVASGRSGAYSHALMGFVPATPTAWLTLQEEILADIAEGRIELSPAANAMALSLLDHQDPKAFWSLAAMAEGDLLLKNRTVALKLDVQDPEAMLSFSEVTR